MRERIGFLAQELEKEFPELVTQPESEDDFYTISYNGMIPVLLEAIKEQQIQIENSQTIVENLQTIVFQQEYDFILLKEQLDALKEQLNACCQRNSGDSLRQQFLPTDEINNQGEIQDESSLKNTSVGENNVDVEKARLFQNIPNPFSANTEIRFEIPENATSAKLLIHDMQGGEINAYTISQRGSSSIIINGFELSAGMYMYTLLVNNTIIDTKKMILTK